MNEQQYRALCSFFGKTPRRAKWVSNFCRIFPGTLFLLYLMGSLCLFSLFIYHRFSLPMILYWIVPAFGFLLTTWIRKKRNAPRPAEVFSFTPLLSHKSGCSFPSRHTACAFLISFALLFLSLLGIFSPILTAFSFLLSVLTATSRVVAGVHFLKDVIGGFLFAAVISVFGFSFAFLLF